ncbi:MAG: hypothetical protein WC642_16180, partial [Nocardioides sp.]
MEDIEEGGPIPASSVTPETARAEIERRATADAWQPEEAPAVKVVDRRGQDWTEPEKPAGPDRDAW